MIKRYLRLSGILFKFKIGKSMVYSFNFWIAFFVDIVLFLFQLVSFVSIYQFTDTINGWTLNQMIVFIGTFTIIDSLVMGTFFFGVISLPDKIRTGTLDIIICKPIDTQFFVSAESFTPGSLFGVIVGIAMVVYGLWQGGYTVHAGQVVGYIILIIMMTTIMYSLMLIIRSFAFLFIRIETLVQTENTLVEFAFKIPGIAFKGLAKIIFLIIIPYGLIATAPTEFITNLLDIKQWLVVTVVTLFFAIVSRLFFRYGLSKYTSASS